MTGLTFLSRLTQIAPPYTRFVFLGAGLRLGLPSHPASPRRSCLRLGVSTTSSSRGLSPPNRSPMPGVLKSGSAALRRWPGVSARLCLGGPPGARRAVAPGGVTDQHGSSVRALGLMVGRRVSGARGPALHVHAREPHPLVIVPAGGGPVNPS